MESKIKLVRGRSYITTASKEEVQESVDLPTPFIILTPYKSKCSDSFDVGSDRIEIRTTPRRLRESLDRVSVSHTLVEDGGIMEGFGYIDDLQKLSAKGVCFILLNTQEAPSFAVDAVFLPLNRYFIELGGDERYIALFILCKVYGKITVMCKDSRRVQMFAKIFNLELVAVSHGESVELERVVVVMDRFLEVGCEKLFYIGMECNGLRRIPFSLSKAGKYLYRIRDVCGALSHSVVNGKKELNMNRFYGIYR